MKDLPRIEKAKPPAALDGQELESFVSNTLKAIIEGIGAAEEYTGRQDGPIRVRRSDSGNFGVETRLADYIEFGIPDAISFDIAVTVSQRSEKGGGLKIEVLSVGANAQGGMARERSTASRVAFSVPVKHQFK